MSMEGIPTPINREEKLQYEMLRRMDALCNMLSSLIEHIAEKDNVATTNHVDVEEEVEEITTLTPKRCIATTKSGTQCKRDALEGSDFCPTHQPKE